MPNKDQNNLAQALLNVTNDLVIILSTKFIIREFNTTAEKVYSWKKKEVIGKSFLELCQSNDLSCPISSDIKKILAGKGILSRESIIENKKKYIIYWNISKLSNPSSDSHDLILVGKDITKTKEEQTKSYYLDGIIKYAPDLIYWKDSNSVHLGCNDKFAEIAGLKSREDVFGKTDFDFAWKSQAESFRNDDLEVISSGRPKLNIEDLVPSSTGEVLVVISNKVPLRDIDGKIIGILGVATDITLRKKAESELIKANKKAKIANKSKSEFLANMSHDIRTPLTGMIGMAEIIEEMAEKTQVKQYATELINASQLLLDLLNEILIITESELENPLKQIQHFSLNDIIKDIEKLMLPSIKNKGISFKVIADKKIPKDLIGNRIYIHRILLNLLSNATKFTEEGHIKLTSKLGKLSKNNAIIKLIVEDTGIGIPKEKFNYIFESFSRLSSSYHGIYKGTGLGLSITKKFIESMNGKVEVKSKLNKGSAFICTIPLELAANKQLPSKATITKTGEKHGLINATTPLVSSHILLVEDNLLAQKIATIKLKKLGCFVDIAETGEKALKLVRQARYDLILMDIGLPDADGYSVTKSIREQKGNSIDILPIIGLTAHTNHKNKSQCIESGMNDVIAKPLTLKLIQEISHKYLYKYTKTDTLLENHKKKNAQKTIDWQLGIEISGNKKNALNMLQILTDDLPNEQTLMEAAIQQNDFKELQFIVHKLYGGICYCGAPSLKKAAAELENIIKSGDRNQILTSYSSLRNEINNLLEEYKKFQETEKMVQQK